MTNTAKTGIVLVSLILLISFLAYGYSAQIQYTNRVGNYWTLADRASTLADKRQFIDRFVAALEKADLEGTHNAAFFLTPENSFDANLTAVKSLQQRLAEIESMDIKSFEYQQALSQVTQQEMNEAEDMLKVFKGCWILENHTLAWSWHAGLIAAILFAGVIYPLAQLK